MIRVFLVMAVVATGTVGCGIKDDPLPVGTSSTD